MRRGVGCCAAPRRILPAGGFRRRRRVRIGRLPGTTWWRLEVRTAQQSSQQRRKRRPVMTTRSTENPLHIAAKARRFVGPGAFCTRLQVPGHVSVLHRLLAQSLRRGRSSAKALDGIACSFGLIVTAFAARRRASSARPAPFDWLALPAAIARARTCPRSVRLCPGLRFFAAASGRGRSGRRTLRRRTARRAAADTCRALSCRRCSANGAFQVRRQFRQFLFIILVAVGHGESIAHGTCHGPAFLPRLRACTAALTSSSDRPALARAGAQQSRPTTRAPSTFV